MRFLLALALVTSVSFSTEAAAARRGHKHHAAAKTKTKAKAASKAPKRAHKATVESKQVAVKDDVVETDANEELAMPEVHAAPMNRGSVAQATDDEEPPAKKR